jgi:hypothetical protein
MASSVARWPFRLSKTELVSASAWKPEPGAAADMAASKDPYYDSTAPGGSRRDRWNYQAWTPGLERMFAPDEPRADWY